MSIKQLISSLFKRKPKSGFRISTVRFIGNEIDASTPESEWKNFVMSGKSVVLEMTAVGLQKEDEILRAIVKGKLVKIKVVE